MAQVKVYGRRSQWAHRRDELSDALHDALVRTWQLPAEKRFHRFLWLDDGDLVAPRGDAYLVIEVVCFTGRSDDAKRALVRALFDDVAPRFDLPADNVEVVILESPQVNWGIRGRAGDELALTYRVDV